MKQLQTVKYILAGLCIGWLAACAGKVDNRGYVASDSFSSLKDAVTVGTSTREEVMDKLGSPSSKSSFGDEAWYYISSRKEGTAFLKPEIVKQEVVRITFNTSGIVSQVETFDEKNSKDFSLVKRTTPTEGHSLGFIEQIIGNIGRFNRPSNDSVAPGRRPGG